MLKTRWIEDVCTTCRNCGQPYRDHKHIEMECPIQPIGSEVPQHDGPCYEQGVLEGLEYAAKLTDRFKMEGLDLRPLAEEIRNLKCQVLQQENSTSAQPAGEPWIYGIQQTNKEGRQSWKDGEQCVFGDRESAQSEVDSLNDEFPEGENPYEVVPLYRVAPTEQERALREEFYTTVINDHAINIQPALFFRTNLNDAFVVGERIKVTVERALATPERGER